MPGAAAAVARAARVGGVLARGRAVTLRAEVASDGRVRVRATRAGDEGGGGGDEEEEEEEEDEGDDEGGAGGEGEEADE